MLTAAQKRAVNGFAKSLVALGDDALIDAHHQAWEDYRDARTEGGDIVDKAYAQSLATKTAMRDRFLDYQPGFTGWIGPTGPKATETLAELPVPSFTRRVRQNSAT